MVQYPLLDCVMICQLPQWNVIHCHMELPPMIDFLIGAAFVMMVVGPAIMASIQHSKSQDH